MTADAPMRRSESAFAAFVRLILSVVAAGSAAGVQWYGIQGEWLLVPTWRAYTAHAISVALAAFAVWQLVLAAHHCTVRKVLWALVQLAGVAVVTVVILYTGTGYAAALAGIGILWLEVIRRTWPRAAFRAPRLRDETFEPPRRYVP